MDYRSSLTRELGRKTKEVHYQKGHSIKSRFVTQANENKEIES